MQRGIWGYTATSAADVARIYEYLLDDEDPAVRDFILGNLRDATRCGTDGRNQHFGIPRAVPEPWAVKQGWSGFGEVPERGCCRHPGAPPPSEPVDITREAMHTSGLVGEDDELTIVVLTLHPVDTRFDTAAERVTDVTRVLYLGNTLPTPTW